MIEAGPVPMSQALQIVEQILDGLIHAHEQGIIHRDLKPENLIQRPDGTITILDLGLAKAVTPASFLRQSINVRSNATQNLTQAVIGSVFYMAPEQRGELPVPVDTRADIYSVAVILKELLTGDIMLPPTQDLFPDDETYTRVLNELLKVALARQPKDRFQTAAKFKLATQCVRTGRRVELTEIPVLELVELLKSTNKNFNIDESKRFEQLQRIIGELGFRDMNDAVFEALQDIKFQYIKNTLKYVGFLAQHSATEATTLLLDIYSSEMEKRFPCGDLVRELTSILRDRRLSKPQIDRLRAILPYNLRDDNTYYQRANTIEILLNHLTADVCNAIRKYFEYLVKCNPYFRHDQRKAEEKMKEAGF